VTIAAATMAAAPAARSGTPCTPNAATDDPPERAAAHTCPTPPIVDAEARWLIDFEAHFTNASAAGARNSFCQQRMRKTTAGNCICFDSKSYVHTCKKGEFIR